MSIPCSSHGAGKVVIPAMWERGSALLDGAFTATEDELRGTIRLLAERNRVNAEGAGGGKIVYIVSGGNIDARVLAEILAA